MRGYTKVSVLMLAFLSSWYCLGVKFLPSRAECSGLSRCILMMKLSRWPPLCTVLRLYAPAWCITRRPPEQKRQLGPWRWRAPLRHCAPCPACISSRSRTPLFSCLFPVRSCPSVFLPPGFPWGSQYLYLSLPPATCKVNLLNYWENTFFWYI